MPDADVDQKPQCEPHRIDAEICGGPHRWVYTELGWELLNPTENPIGTPCDPDPQYATPPNIRVDE